MVFWRSKPSDAAVAAAGAESRPSDSSSPPVGLAESSTAFSSSSLSTQTNSGVNSAADASSLIQPSTTGSSATSKSESSGCPMHKADGTYSYDWRALWRAGFPHGPDGSKPLDASTVAEATAPTSPSAASTTLSSTSAESSPSCPVVSKSSTRVAAESGTGGGGGGCPVKHSDNPKTSSPHPQYNVYSQPIDPTNQMPYSPHQFPAPTQSVPLSTERVASSIPKGGAVADEASAGNAGVATTWLFPSPQMFYNALARKGKLDDTVQHDMESVVALHNNMNEKTWRKVLEWEEVVTAASSNGEPIVSPKLLKFQGRPTDLSPKAAFKHYILGHPLPYDRHDWTIERSDGSTVRYIIDYYHDESRARDDAASATPHLHDFSSGSNSLLVDVRPALDSPQAVWHRAVTMPYAQQVKSTRFEALPLAPTSTMKHQVAESVQVWRSIQASAAGSDNGAASTTTTTDETVGRMSEEQARDLQQKFATLRRQCRGQQRKLDRCTDATDEGEYARASMDLTICMAQTVCPVQHSALVQCLSSANDNDEAIAQALSVVQECVTLQAEHHAAAKKEFPHVFKA